ncbi:SDR family NAD(P)-dependent oxidoreductase [Salipaludibacillus sp. CF4.18]|uniref:SDR family NAD(P)-dependent oxidoreductase n=1 Tax=Salipaludibacillus sp. CF4.18 TaxID=3373081 RepID=UPI003EE7B616
MQKWQGKEILVTGGANGIGKAIATAFLEQGAKVWIIDKKEEAGKGLVARLTEKGYHARFINVDVSKKEEIYRLFDKLKQENVILDSLINNAGISSFIPLDELTMDHWEEVIHTNLTSVMLFSKLGSKLMHKGSSIINIASTRASMSEPGSEAYAASKGGIIALTHALASSLTGLGIQVNTISPGWIQTENYQELREKDHSQHWSNRVGTPDDIARACLFLADSKNDFINGENITIDGGMTRKMIYNH